MMLDMSKVVCTTALEVELLAEVSYLKRQLSRHIKPKPEPVSHRRPLRFTAPPEEVRTFPTVTQIQYCVCARFDVTREELLSERRLGMLVLARAAAIILAQILTPYSSTQIGRRFGGRDHSTVLHHVRKYGDIRAQLIRELKPDDPLQAWVDAVHDKIAPVKLGDYSAVPIAESVPVSQD